MNDKPQLLQYDNLDSRREISYILSRLSPARRLRFLAWACTQARLGPSQIQPKISDKTWALAEQARWDSSASERLTLETYLDLWMLSINYRVNLDNLIRKLEAFARGAFKADPAEPVVKIARLDGMRA